MNNIGGALVAVLALLFGALVILGPIAGVIVLVVTAEKRKRKKKAATLSEFARRHGWTYRPSDPSLVQRWRGQPFTGRGGAEHILYGAYRAHHVLMFEYNHTQFEIKASDDMSAGAVYSTVVALTLPGPRPWLQVTPRGWGLSERFDKAFEVSTSGNPHLDAGVAGERFAADVLHAGLMDWMVRDERARENPVRFEGTELLTWSEGRLDADRALRLADYLIDFVGQVPDFALRR
jgi:hypothetical protein